jgi:tetratricopeptide (TPR) repeat protein
MFCFGLLTKEIMIVFPLIIFFFDIMFRKDRLKNFYIFVRPFFGFVLIALAYLLLRQYLVGSITNVQLVRNVYSNFLTQLNVSIFYFKIFFLPIDLCIGRYFPMSRSFLEPRVIQSFLIFLAIFLFAGAAFKKNALFTFAIIWYFVNLIPKFIASLALVATEHHLYLPAIGIFIAIGIGIEKSIYFLQNKAKFLKLIAIAFFSILFIIMSVLTFRRLEVWQDEYNLWLNNIRYSPQAWGAYNNLGLVFLNEGKYEEALNSFNKALEGSKTVRSDPLLVDVYTNLGKLYLLKGDFNAAEAELKKVLEIDPSVAEVHNNLGLVYAQKGLRSQEIAEFKLAIALNPSLIEAYNNLAVSYWLEKKSNLAIETLEKAIEVNPDYPKSYLILAKIFEDLGNFQKVLELREKALSLSPSDANDYFNLGTLYGKMGDIKALDYFKKAIAIDPKFAAAHYNLAVTYANLKPPQMELAAKHARLALEYGYKVRPELLKELGIK